MDVSTGPSTDIHGSKKQSKIPSDPSSLFALIDSHPGHQSSSNLIDLLHRTPRQLLCCLPEDGQEDVLDGRLKPEVNGIAYFFVLLSRFETCAGSLDPQNTISQAEKFCANVSRAQLLALSPNLVSFVQYLVQWTSQARQLERCLEPIAKLVKSYMPPDVLTPLHSELMRVSLLCRSTDLALEISNHDILAIDQERCPVQYQDHLIYHYLAGTVQALHKNYQRAVHLLTIAVSAPGPGISQFQIEAYKKLILLSLLLSSSPPVLPRYTHPQLRPTFRNSPSGKMYHELISLYEVAHTGGEAYAKLRLMVEKNRPGFQKDNNLGLVTLCINSLPNKAVLKLIPTYISVPVERIDAALEGFSAGPARDLLQRMIAAGELDAEVDETANVVRFAGRPALDEEQMNKDLQRTISRVRGTEQMMHETSAMIERDREFLRRVAHDVHNAESLHTDMVLPEKQYLGLVEEDLAVDMGMAWDD